MSFITIDKLNGSSGETISTITVPEYQGLEDRTQSFKVVVDGKEVFVNVQQKAFKPSLTTNKQVIPFTQEVLSQSLQITSNFNWEARTDSSWFTLSQTDGTKGTTTIEISTSSIDSPSENRNGTINFYLGDTFVTAITVKQEFEVIFEVSTTSIDMTDETTATINVTSNVDWYCNTDATWVYIDIVSGFGDKTITVTAQTFNGQDRNGTINFYVGGEIIKTVNVYQTLFVQIPTDVENCFYIEPYNAGETISMSWYNSLYYFNKGEWKFLEKNSTINTNRRLYIKDFNYLRGGWSFDSNNLFNIGGNIETLLGEMKEFYAFSLFSDLGVVDASNLMLPSTTLAPSCYSNMFRDCTSLTNAPELPATIIVDDCYSQMFDGCTSLVNPPKISATSLGDSSCYAMFRNCTSLVTAPDLNVTTLGDACYFHMFKGCTSLVNAPELPVTTLTDQCYESMFYGCTSLVEAFELPATTLAPSCYESMFYGCTNLNNITMLATNIFADKCLDEWTNGVSSIGTFTKKKGVKIGYGSSGIPNGWTVVEVD